MSTFIPSTPTFAPSTSLKRKRDSALPPTPPLAAVDDRASHETLRLVGHVLATEAAALSSLAIRYQEKIDAKHGFLRAVDCICAAVHAHHKVVVCGVGKSGIVGMKLVATMKSLGIASSFLHAGEAQHGDLGDIRPGDAILFITFSGKTQELLGLLPHIHEKTPVMAITSNSDSQILANRHDSIYLPAGIPISEQDTFGVRAPTTSTTVAMAVGDALALACAERMHRNPWTLEEVFKRNHPGGAIGEKKITFDDSYLRDVAAQIGEMNFCDRSKDRNPTIRDIRSAVSESGSEWVMVDQVHLMKPSAIARLKSATGIPKLQTPLTSVYRVPWNFTVAQAIELTRFFPDKVKREGVLGIEDKDGCGLAWGGLYAVVEIQDLLRNQGCRDAQDG